MDGGGWGRELAGIRSVHVARLFVVRACAWKMGDASHRLFACLVVHELAIGFRALRQSWFEAVLILLLCCKKLACLGKGGPFD